MSQFGDNNPNWKGGRRLHSKGYIEIYFREHPRAQPNGYVLEHILVMEKKLGRSLADHELVHHKDENKTNNHPDNLELMPRADHTRHHHPYKDRFIDLDEATEMFKAGKTAAEVAKHFGVSDRKAVYRAFHREGAPG
jgi:hypothetical protein